MRHFQFILLIAMSILFTSCSDGQPKTTNTNLSAVEFSEKINSLPTAPILDVRTPGEYSQGHLKNAVNYDWNGNNFQNQISTIDKTNPVFVYCLSGGRSTSAAKYMRSLGFEQVYELNGGTIKWRAANLPLTTK